MNLFYRAFNVHNLAVIGVKLPPKELNELIERLHDTLRARLHIIAEQRIGRPLDQGDKDLIRAYFPDYHGVLQVECMRLFQEVEEHADEIMGNGWRMAA